MIFPHFGYSGERSINEVGDVVLDVRIMNGLAEGLEAERKRIPGQILYDADRLECLLSPDSVHIPV